MNGIPVQELVSLGLSKYQARAYLALLGHEESTAVEVAERSGVPRQRVYDVLASLKERALVATKNGRPMRYTAQAPVSALAGLLQERRRKQRAENERLTLLVEKVVADLQPDGSANGPQGVVRAGANAPGRGCAPVGGF